MTGVLDLFHLRSNFGRPYVKFCDPPHYCWTVEISTCFVIKLDRSAYYADDEENKSHVTQLLADVDESTHAHTHTHTHRDAHTHAVRLVTPQ